MNLCANPSIHIYFARIVQSFQTDSAIILCFRSRDADVWGTQKMLHGGYVQDAGTQGSADVRCAMTLSQKYVILLHLLHLLDPRYSVLFWPSLTTFYSTGQEESICRHMQQLAVGIPKTVHQGHICLETYARKCMLWPSTAGENHFFYPRMPLLANVAI
jgi:hypothetical protein